MNTEPLTTLKGIGEKTEKLFAKVGIYNLQQLLHYYQEIMTAMQSRFPFANADKRKRMRYTEELSTVRR